MQTARIKIGNLLLQEKLITQAQLDTAMQLQSKQGGKLGNILIEQGFVTRDVMLQTLSQQLKLPFIDLTQFDFDPELVKKLPENIARRYRVLLLEQESHGVLVGMADPQDIFAFGELSRILKVPLKIALVDEAILIKALDMLYRNAAAISGFADELAEEIDSRQLNLSEVVGELKTSDAPVAKLLQSLFEDAVQVRASDIHIEPDENILRIRLRVDGVLQEQVLKSKSVALALTQRLKLMANLDISEKRLPQDGRFNIRIKNKSFDVRLSTMPTRSGETVVMRLLDQSQTALSLEQLGMPDLISDRVRKLVQIPHGLVLVTGPTGSGKTTTLYSVLRELNQPEVKIITVEDPVEYHLARVNQIQVNPKIDLDFARVLRAALRQDPDILLIGEIRDMETAEIALRAAITGHLVLATLHTNDAASSATRLLDMGVAAFMVAAALRAVIAQRLVREICKSCHTQVTPTVRERSWLNRMQVTENVAFYQGKGCTACHHTGFSGRIGVYQLLELNEQMISALQKEDPNAFYAAALEAPLARSLGAAALDLAIAGRTTIEEAIGIAGEINDVF